MSSTYLVLSPLVHHLGALLLDNHLLLAVRERPRHAEQQRARADHPQRLAAEQQPALDPRRRRVVLGRHAAARCGGDDVL